MKKVLRPLMILLAAATLARADTMMIQDFKKPDAKASVWIVGVPNENASVAVADNALKLKYHFTGANQYLGVPVPVDVKAPIYAVKFRLFGDESGAGYNLYLTDAGGETHKFVTHQKIDWKGWKEIDIRVDGSHEIWGGDKNHKIDYPLKDIVFEIGTPGKDTNSEIMFTDIRVESSASEAEMRGGTITVASPAYCADINGDTKVDFNALGFKTITVTAFNAASGKGVKETIAKNVPVDDKGNGSFNFPASRFPKGPLTLTLSGARTLNGKEEKDNCYLQVYNKGGKTGFTGAPKTPPPAAKGMKLAFADDFDSPKLSIGKGPDFKYYDHKPPDGSQDFSDWGTGRNPPFPFTSFDKPNNPFAQMDTFLRIRGQQSAKSTGILSSLQGDGSGFKATAPCYFECRFIAPNAPGSWPAFWLLTDNTGHPSGCDELDIIEAYGGEGPGNPNSFDKYMICPHAWDQGEAGKKLEQDAYKQMPNPHEMIKAGVSSAWYESFHTYGCLITETDTVYYCDDIEVGRHKTFPISKERPHYFLVNLAVGGISGWKVDLDRYNGVIDMYVDYIRVYQGEKNK